MKNKDGYITARIIRQEISSNDYNELKDLAVKLSAFKKYLWYRYSSIPKRLRDRDIRDSWLEDSSSAPLIRDIPARLWKETLRVTIDEIKLYWSSKEPIIIKKIYSRFQDKEIRKEMVRRYKNFDFSDPFIHRIVRELITKGRPEHLSAIYLDNCSYRSSIKYGVHVLSISTLNRGKRLNIELKSKNIIDRSIKILPKNNNIIEIHVPVSHNKIEVKDKEYDILGVDLGYQEVATDNLGNKYGKTLGSILDKSSDFFREKYQVRYKLNSIMQKAIASKEYKKANNIKRYNLGTKKIRRYKSNIEQEIKTVIYSSAKKICKNSKELVLEDLSKKANKTPISKIVR